MKAVAVSLFLLAVLMVYAAIMGFSSSIGWVAIVGAMPAAIVVYMFLRVAAECRAIERQKRQSDSKR